jgi:hypothetical protein
MKLLKNCRFWGIIAFFANFRQKSIKLKFLILLSSITYFCRDGGEGDDATGDDAEWDVPVPLAQLWQEVCKEKHAH